VEKSFITLAPRVPGLQRVTPPDDPFVADGESAEAVEIYGKGYKHFYDRNLRV
jgi:hypothetical protein